MEVIMSSPVKESSRIETDHDNGAAKLTKSHKKIRKRPVKKAENLVLLEKTENPKSKPEVESGPVSLSSLQDTPNSGIGTYATVDTKMAMSSPAAAGEEVSLSSERKEYTEVADGEMGLSGTTNLNVEVVVQKKMETGVGETSSGTNAADNTTLKKRKRKKKKNENSASGDILSTREDTHEGLSITDVIGVKSDEIALGENKIANMVSKEKDHTEAANGRTGESGTTENKQPTLGEILNLQYLQNLEASKGETDSVTTSAGNPTSERRKKIRKKKKKNNSELGDILSTHDEITQEGLSTTKVLEVKSGETVLSKTATLDSNMVLKDLTEAANGKTGEGETSTSNPAPEKRKKTRKKMKKNNSELGDIPSICESTQEVPSATKVLEVKSGETALAKTATLDSNMVLKEDLTEAANGKTGESETSTGNPTSEKIKKTRKKKKKNNSELGDIPSIRESTQEGPSTTKLLEVKSGETALAKTATPDANMVPKGDHTEVADHRMEETETTNLNVNGKEEEEKNPKSKNKQPTLGEILNAQYLQNLEAAKGETDLVTTSKGDQASKKRRRKKMRSTNSELGDILSTHEIAQEGLSTSRVVEVKSGETVLAKTVTPNANMVSKGDYTEAANGKTWESEPSTDNPASKKRKRKKNKNSQSGDVLSAHEITQDGLSTTKVLEVKSGETVLAKTATPDANMMSKRDHTEASNCRMGETETTNLNVNGKEEKKNITCTQTSDGDSEKSEKGKSQDTIITNKGSSTTESERGGLEEIVNGEKFRSTIADAQSTLFESIVCLQDANTEMGSTTIVLNSAEPAELEITEAKANQELEGKSQEITQVATSGKKLLVLDVNGLLADLVSPRPQGITADAYIRKRAVFKRPYLDDFLCFCFERFHVGIWSSRIKRNLRPVINFLLGDWKQKLLFMWDGTKCTKSGVKTPEVTYKKIVVKDLRRIWAKGTFDESNTLLVDDAPYKALLNPKHTGIFPLSYSYQNVDDNFLGPKGELRIYLEGLAAADDVKTYVEQHPFGQGAIDEQSPDWDFYSHVLKRLNERSTSAQPAKSSKKKRSSAQKRRARKKAKRSNFVNRI